MTMITIIARVERRDMDSAVAEAIKVPEAGKTLVPAPYRWQIGGLHTNQQSSAIITGFTVRMPLVTRPRHVHSGVRLRSL